MKNPSSVEEYYDQHYNWWLLLAQTRDAIFKARQKELNQYNISAIQADVLFTIQAFGDKVNPAEISRWLFREPHSVSELLNRMEKKGLIKKAKDPHRKNVVRVVLTEKGREAYYQSSKRDSIDKIMSSLSGEECQQLMSCLQTLQNRALKELGADYKRPSQPSQ